MSDGKWFVADMISQLEEKQYRMCTWIKNIDPQRPERDKLIEAVQHLSHALSALEKIIKMVEK